LYADVAGAISGSGGVRGNIGKGLKEAIYGQIEQMDLARDFEGLPITAAATRSRGSTFEAQQRVLESVYTALTSRGETNALIEGRLDEIQDSLAQAGRMTPDNMVKFQSVLMWMEERDLISEEGMKKAVRELGALGAAAAGMSPLIFQ
jgi:BMFP domain-containing protein YqiC